MYNTENIKLITVEIKLDIYHFELTDTDNFDYLLTETLDIPSSYLYNYLLEKFKDKISDGIYTKNDIKYCKVTIKPYNEIEKVDLYDILNY